MRRASVPSLSSEMLAERNQGQVSRVGKGRAKTYGLTGMLEALDDQPVSRPVSLRGSRGVFEESPMLLAKPRSFDRPRSEAGDRYWALPISPAPVF